jgi:hypothetical protein
MMNMFAAETHNFAAWTGEEIYGWLLNICCWLKELIRVDDVGRLVE